MPFGKLMRAKVFAFCAILLVCSEATAQAPTFDQQVGNTADRLIPQDPPVGADERAPLDQQLQGPPGGQQLSPEAAALTILLKAVEIKNNTVFDVGEFDELYAPLIGQEVTLGQLANVAADIQTFYRMEGYVFTRAILLQDGLNEGVATIRVIEGVVGTVSVEESAEPVGPVFSLLSDMAKQLEGTVSPHISDLERILLIMNDVPGITRATAVPRANRGGQAGLIDIVINVERDPLSGIVFADNRQAPSAGRGLVGAAVEYASYTSGGDTTQFTFLNSFGANFDGVEQQVRDLRERRVFQIEHSRYLHENGLQAWFRGLYSVTNLAAELTPIAIEGEPYEFEIGLRYPILRTRPLSLIASASFEYTELENDVNAGSAILTNDNLRVFTVGLDALMRDSTGFTAAGLEFRQGSTILGSSERGDPFLSRGDGNPAGTLLAGYLERDQQIYEGFSANVRAGGQWAWTQLLSSEEFQIGGTSFGRGYDPSEFSGDSGYGVAAELRYTQDLEFLSLAELRDSTVQVYGFWDYGRVFNIGSGLGAGGALEVADISSFGGGLRFDLPYQIFLELEVAKPVEKLQRSAKNDAFVYFEAQKRF
jgi:hemolysin activation/secretion protein